ncbi:flagellar hook capping FlgD N-terminal domain-containing protein [Oceanobacillus alkalisoli]|uniref:flagellar hook capping FlgD N-terminal domain-containing protein n=1 Tax=Oceanobacillus alkalisoli TaxID=2925113 RepID=UPI001EEF9FEC|nr:flagellar hook capping FlgD N-terminal domain-containing protein [Oceanobacillus alkalisoli]MCF3942429.1 flagellar hook assembly protein FlgD [Oceanobacillus alkalisoli]MCG5103486.1 flagellar hook assembly protein FlgD [Oceanobacillus alkalisoli]
MYKIDPSLYLSNQPKTREPKPDLDKEGFIKILIAQLQEQDPTAPMNSQEMVAQMTQLSSLEQMMNMSSSIEMLVQSQLVSPVIEYSHMIGKFVSYELDNGDSEEEIAHETKTSQVVAISQQDGWAILELENGDKIYADAVIEVRNK